MPRLFFIALLLSPLAHSANYAALPQFRIFLNAREHKLEIIDFGGAEPEFLTLSLHTGELKEASYTLPLQKEDRILGGSFSQASQEIFVINDRSVVCVDSQGLRKTLWTVHEASELADVLAIDYSVETPDDYGASEQSKLFLIRKHPHDPKYQSFYVIRNGTEELLGYLASNLEKLPAIGRYVISIEAMYRPDRIVIWNDSVLRKPPTPEDFELAHIMPHSSWELIGAKKVSPFGLEIVDFDIGSGKGFSSADEAYAQIYQWTQVTNNLENRLPDMLGEAIKHINAYVRVLFTTKASHILQHKLFKSCEAASDESTQ